MDRYAKMQRYCRSLVESVGMPPHIRSATMRSDNTMYYHAQTADGGMSFAVTFSWSNYWLSLETIRLEPCTIDGWNLCTYHPGGPITSIEEIPTNYYQRLTDHNRIRLV